jgi:hypothetical protein
MLPMPHVQRIKAAVAVGAVIVSIAYIGIAVLWRQYSPTTIATLAGRWSGRWDGQDLVFNVDTKGSCSLLVSGRTDNSIEYFGVCEIGRDKAPVTLTMRELPAFDFNLYTIVARVTDSQMLMAPIAKRKRARAITFDNAFMMERSHL